VGRGRRLTSPDLPPGWRRSATDESDRETECSAIDYSDLTLTGDAKRSFEGDDAIVLEHQISVYSDEGDAIDAVVRGDERQLADCVEEGVEAPIEGEADLELTGVRVRELPSFGYSDAERRLRMTGRLREQGTPATADVPITTEIYEAVEGRAVGTVLVLSVERVSGVGILRAAARELVERMRSRPLPPGGD
jgi:hypothetical protein